MGTQSINQGLLLRPNCCNNVRPKKGQLRMWYKKHWSVSKEHSYYAVQYNADLKI
jgi:hypothetical protein